MHKDDMAEIVRLGNTVRDKTMPLSMAKVFYAALLVGYKTLEYYERMLLRYLHWTHGLTFQRMVDVLDTPNLTTRQAVWSRWKQLNADDRRVIGSPVRGGRKRSVDQ